MTMRVLHLISSLQLGGAEKLLLSLLDCENADKTVEYTVVIMNEQINPDLRKRLEAHGYPVYFMNRPEGHIHPKYLFSLLSVLRKHRIQLVHAHNYGSKSWAMLCKLFIPLLKIVVTIHDTPIVARLSHAQRFLHKVLIDANIAISGAVEEECLKYGLKKTARIYNGIPVAEFPYREPDLRKRPLVLINVARMDYHKKGQDVLIEAVRICRDWGIDVQCRLVGSVCDDNQELLSDLKQKVYDNRLDDHVAFVINQSDVYRWLRQSDVFVLPSRYEGFGLVLLEAMASGLPVIASNVDGPKELIRDGSTGYLFECGNPLHLAEKIRHVFNNPGSAKATAENAGHFAQQFDISRMGRDYLTLYQSLIPADAELKPESWRLNHEPSV